MSRRGVSCRSLALWGCGGLVFAVVLLTLSVGLRFWIDAPDARRIVHRETVEMLSSVGDKPIRLTLSLQALIRLDLVAGTEDQSKLTADYDEQNFDLETHIEETADHIDYHISLLSKKPVWVYNAILTGARYDNRVHLTVPTGAALELMVHAEIGEYHLDLTDLRLRSLDITCRKGSLWMSARAPNPIAMKTLRVRSELAEITLEDVQRYRFSEGRFESKLGKLALLSSGEFEPGEMAVWIDSAYSEILLRLPPNAGLSTEQGSVFDTMVRGTPEKAETRISLGGTASFSNGSIVWTEPPLGGDPHVPTHDHSEHADR